MISDVKKNCGWTIRKCSRKNFVFLFGALINLTVRVDAYFHQSG